jgi:hypothetical protein
MRIVKIISPVQRILPEYDERVPCEGDLVMRKNNHVKRVPWTVDANTNAPLKGLFENEQTLSGLDFSGL